MVTLVLYVSGRYVYGSKRKEIISAAKSSLRDGLNLDDEDITVILEIFEDGSSNERVHHCFFPIMYTPAGTPYAYKKKVGELMNERLHAVPGMEEFDHVYFHMKEHEYENVAVNGVLLKYDSKAISHIDKTRGENTTPWLG